MSDLVGMGSAAPRSKVAAGAVVEPLADGPPMMLSALAALGECLCRAFSSLGRGSTKS
jgi:hypothetical protein